MYVIFGPILRVCLDNKTRLELSFSNNTSILSSQSLIICLKERIKKHPFKQKHQSKKTAMHLHVS